MSFVEKTLGELAIYINGRGFKPADWGTKGLPIVRIANLNNTNAPFDYFDGVIDEGHAITGGDILVSWSATLDAFIWNRGPAALNQHIFKVLPNADIIDSGYLFFVLKQAMKGLEEHVHGATMKHVTRPEFEGFKVQIESDVDVQRQIAARLKAQLAEVDKARQAAETQLRELNFILNQIIEEQITSVIAKGETPLRLGEVSSISAKIVNPTLPEFCDLPHVSAENIESMTGRLVNIKSAKEDGMISGKYLFDDGDILYSKLRPYLRKVAKSTFNGLCSADMYPIKTEGNRLNMDFLQLLLTSNLFTDYANEKSARSRMPKLNREQLFEFEFSLPSIGDQQECVSKISEAVDCVSQATSSAKIMLNDINLLPQKILAQAFVSTTTQGNVA